MKKKKYDSHQLHDKSPFNRSYRNWKVHVPHFEFWRVKMNVGMCPIQNAKIQANEGYHAIGYKTLSMWYKVYINGYLITERSKSFFKNILDFWFNQAFCMEENETQMCKKQECAMSKDLYVVEVVLVKCTWKNQRLVALKATNELLLKKHSRWISFKLTDSITPNSIYTIVETHVL